MATNVPLFPNEPPPAPPPPDDRCGAVCPLPPTRTGRWRGHRMPVCNRARGHGGSHRKYDWRAFRIVAEWEDR